MSAHAISVDVGNSSVGVGLWQGGSVRVRRLREPEEAVALIAASPEALAADTAVISVSPPRLARLLAEVRRMGAPALRVLDRPPAGLRAATPGLLATAGADRLGIVLAAAPGPAVVIDAGTAVTIDVLDAQGVYCGGFIAPGPRSSAAGLAAATAQLPELDGARTPLHPGTETRAALAAGLWGMAVGGVDRLVDAALADLRAGGAAPIRLVATGGWAAAWAADSRHEGIDLVADLIHRGIARWAGWM